MSRSTAERAHAIAARLIAGGNVAIHGGAGTGKSYIAGAAADAVESQAPSVVVVFIDVSTFASGAAVFLEAARACGFAEATDDSVHACWQHLSQRASSGDLRYVLVLEEFDRVLKFPDGDEFLRLLRELLHKPKRSHLTALVVARRMLKVIEEKIRGISTLEGIFASEFAHPLSAADICEGWPLAPLDADQMSDLIEWSAGVAVLVDRYVQSEVERGTRDASDAAMRQGWIAKYLQYLSDVGLLDATAQFILGPVVATAPTARAKLRAMSVIGEDCGPRPGPPALAECEWFRSALKSATVNLEPWGNRGRAELAGRRVVAAVLTSGDHGLDGSGLPRAASQVVADSRVRAAREGAAPTTYEELVCYFDTGEFWLVIEAMWPVICDAVTPPNRNYWRVRFAALGGVSRNQGVVQVTDQRIAKGWARDIEEGFELTRRPRTLRAAPLEHGGDRERPASAQTIATQIVMTGDGNIGLADRGSAASIRSGGWVGTPETPGFWRIAGGVLAALAAVAGIISAVVYFA